MKGMALALIRFYQKVISPALPSVCRYVPTCSQYGYEAIGKYGIWKGGRMTLWRILRCNPLAKGGVDPVP